VRLEAFFVSQYEPPPIILAYGDHVIVLPVMIMGINLVIAVADGDWFEMLRGQPHLSEVNFLGTLRCKFPSASAGRDISVQAACAP
jgi:hypothetical protein